MDQYTTFCRPAPNLELFGIVDDLSGYITLVNLLTSLFNGNALMLHDFCLMGPRLVTGVGIQWGQQLRSMKLRAIDPQTGYALKDWPTKWYTGYGGPFG